MDATDIASAAATPGPCLPLIRTGVCTQCQRHSSAPGETFELRLGIRDGLPDAMHWVYRHYRCHVLRVVRNGFVIPNPRPTFVPGVWDQATREDIVQDVFLKALEERARRAYDVLRPYRPYLLASARHVCIDRARQRRTRERAADATWVRGPRSSSELVLWTDVTSSPLPDEWEDRLERAHHCAALEALLPTLDAEMRTYHHLRFGNGLSQTEVACRMGTSRRRVRTLEHRLLTRARRTLFRRC
jgi:RNA polymerase sigma factor (sigma-70 family)